MGRDQTYDHLIKLLVIGNSGVGKTNMLLRFCENNFLTSHISTIGIDFKTKTVQMDGKKIRMQIWDTAGQQRFKTITQTYYRGAMGILMVYSVDEKESFYDIENWVKQIKLHASHNVIKVLAGNKSDSGKRQVTKEEGEKLAKQIGIPFFETSAKNGDNIEGCFMTLAKQVKQSFVSDQNQINVITFTGSKLTKKKNEDDHQKKKKCC